MKIRILLFHILVILAISGCSSETDTIIGSDNDNGSTKIVLSFYNDGLSAMNNSSSTRSALDNSIVIDDAGQYKKVIGENLRVVVYSKEGNQVYNNELQIKEGKLTFILTSIKLDEVGRILAFPLACPSGKPWERYDITDVAPKKVITEASLSMIPYSWNFENETQANKIKHDNGIVVIPMKSMAHRVELSGKILFNPYVVKSAKVVGVTPNQYATELDGPKHTPVFGKVLPNDYINPVVRPTSEFGAKFLGVVDKEFAKKSLYTDKYLSSPEMLIDLEPMANRTKVLANHIFEESDTNEPYPTSLSILVYRHDYDLERTASNKVKVVEFTHEGKELSSYVYKDASSLNKKYVRIKNVFYAFDLSTKTVGAQIPNLQAKTIEKLSFYNLNYKPKVSSGNIIYKINLSKIDWNNNAKEDSPGNDKDKFPNGPEEIPEDVDEGDYDWLTPLLPGEVEKPGGETPGGEPGGETPGEGETPGPGTQEPSKNEKGFKVAVEIVEWAKVPLDVDYNE